jgi:hypothetical protein
MIEALEFSRTGRFMQSVQVRFRYNLKPREVSREQKQKRSGKRGIETLHLAQIHV